jgi:hypothetical protein
MKMGGTVWFATALALAATGCPTTAPGPDVQQQQDVPPSTDTRVAEGGGTAAPTITGVAWTHAAGCAAGVRGNVTVTVTATDTDTPANSLTFAGSAAGCMGTISGAMSTLSCPEAAPYPTTVTVTDPEGHSAMLAFTIPVCANGTAP